MKKVLVVIGLLLLFDVALLLWDPGGKAVRRAQPGAVRVGLVFDVGGRGDKSFNDAAYAGLMRARDELAIEAEYIEPGEGADRESAIRIFASRGFSLIIGVGFIFTDDITLLAREYPRTHFACVDYSLQVDAAGNVVPPPDNVVALKFREEEGSFLVGAIAGQVSRTKKVGFVGGMDIPLIRRFEAGYQAGVLHVCPDCRVVANYAGVTGSAFKDPGKGKELALAQYRQGTDIIFHASGSTGLGVFEAARLAGKLAIGVDADQYPEAPGHILTSMIKRVDVAVLEIIGEVAQGRFRGGVRSFGLAEDGVGYVRDEHNQELIPEAVRTRVEELRRQIVGKAITVPIQPR
ncbi:MAG: BMP family ABC transporter substrate-binding protein [Deltaproteobacteria bacterium]|nr:BMP family ABC transporter substrate-binding protein [Deltaproteobacteria bacterium]